MEDQQREELLERRTGEGQLLAADAHASATRHVHNSKRVLAEAYEAGVGILGSMSGQRERLKATHRKVLDVLNAVGLSDSVLRLAERRQRMDQLIVYGGMGVMLLVVGLVWWFWKR
jgi:Golgi SNAP receptor complex protein 2